MHSKNTHMFFVIYIWGADIRPALSDVFAAGDAGFPNQSGAGDVYD